MKTGWFDMFFTIVAFVALGSYVCSTHFGVDRIILLFCLSMAVIRVCKLIYQHTIASPAVKPTTVEGQG